MFKSIVKVKDLDQVILDSQEIFDDSDSDQEMKELAKEEIKDAQNNLEILNKDLEVALIPKDPNDSANIILEVRAGTGGDEAAIFAGDLFRMYSRFAEEKRAGGYRSIKCLRS